MSGRKKEINPIIGKRIKQARESIQMEQQELAKRMDLTKSAVCKVESGAVDVNLSSLQNYAKILNVSINYLLGIDNNSSDPKIIAASTITTDGKPIILHSEEIDTLQRKKNSLAKQIWESNYTEEQIDKIKKMIDLMI